MKRKHLFVISLFFCLGIGAVFAAEAAQPDTSSGIIALPDNTSETSQQAATEQQKMAQRQALRKQRIRQMTLVGFGYVIVLGALLVLLMKYRKPITATVKKGSNKWVIRQLIVLGIFILLMMLNPLWFFFSKDYELAKAVTESGLIAGLLLVGAFLVWGVRKTRTKWPFLTIMLYGVIFLLLLVPMLMSVFVAIGHPDADIMDIRLKDIGNFYTWLFTFQELEPLILWGIAFGLLAVQACLLIVPVQIKHQRPKQRRGIWFTAIIAALLYTLLLFAAGLSIMFAVWGDEISELVFWVLVGILPLNWIGWSVAFCLFSRSIEPESFIRRLMRWLIGGSILELLIAVPSHIIVRHRDVCCAHMGTAAGLTTGLAVIFFAFGPGLYFLYSDRIRSKRVNLPEQAERANARNTGGMITN